MKLLAVDDDPIILELLSEIIRSTTDHEILTAESSREAVELMLEEGNDDIDCFLLDIQMPEVDGIEFARQIRKSGAFPFTPIIMLTAMHEKKYVDAAFTAGANDYITKPFEVSEIDRRLALAQKRGEQLRAMDERRNATKETRESYGLLDTVPIFDVDNVVDYFSLENYLPSLPKRSLFGSVALGIQIRNIEEIHEATNGFQFAGIIEDVAEAVSDALRDYQCLIAYAGNGTYVCVIEDKHIPNRGRLADEINLRLQQQGAEGGLPVDAPIRVCCGDTVRLMSQRPERIQDLLGSAQASAVQNARDVERNLDKFWFLGQVAQ